MMWHRINKGKRNRDTLNLKKDSREKIIHFWQGCWSAWASVGFCISFIYLCGVEKYLLNAAELEPMSWHSSGTGTSVRRFCRDLDLRDERQQRFTGGQ